MCSETSRTGGFCRALCLGSNENNNAAASLDYHLPGPLKEGINPVTTSGAAHLMTITKYHQCALFTAQPRRMFKDFAASWDPQRGKRWLVKRNAALRTHWRTRAITRNTLLLIWTSGRAWMAGFFEPCQLSTFNSSRARAVTSSFSVRLFDRRSLPA